MLQHLLATSPYSDWLSALRSLPRGLLLVAMGLLAWVILLVGGYLAVEAGELVRTVIGM